MQISFMDTKRPEWKRLWKAPRRAQKRLRFTGNTPQVNYLYEKSQKRFYERSDVKTLKLKPEIGRVESFRFYTDDISERANHA